MHVQNRAVVNLFRGPNLIEDVAVTMRRLEEGDLKLRVRALDSERALTRVLVRPLCHVPSSRWFSSELFDATWGFSVACIQQSHFGGQQIPNEMGQKRCAERCMGCRALRRLQISEE